MFRLPADAFGLNILDRPRFGGCSPRKFDRDTPPIPNHTWRLATGDLSHIVSVEDTCGDSHSMIGVRMSKSDDDTFAASRARREASREDEERQKREALQAKQDEFCRQKANASKIDVYIRKVQSYIFENHFDTPKRHGYDINQGIISEREISNSPKQFAKGIGFYMTRGGLVMTGDLNHPFAGDHILKVFGDKDSFKGVAYYECGRSQQRTAIDTLPIDTTNLAEQLDPIFSEFLEISMLREEQREGV